MNFPQFAFLPTLNALLGRLWGNDYSIGTLGQGLSLLCIPGQ